MESEASKAYEILVHFGFSHTAMHETPSRVAPLRLVEE